VGEEGMPADVGGDLIVRPGGFGDADERGRGGAGGEAAAAARQEQRRIGGSVLPPGSFGLPVADRVAQLLADGDFAYLTAPYTEHALAGRHLDVGDVRATASPMRSPAWKGYR